MIISFDKTCQVWQTAADPNDEYAAEALRHILVEVRGRLASADGFMLSLVPCSIHWDDGEKREPVAIEATMFKLAASNAGKSPTATIFVKAGKATVNCKRHKAVSDVWTGEYPDYKKLFPDTLQGALDSQSLDAELTLKLAKAMGTTMLTYIFSGPDRPVVCLPLSSPVDAVGLIMPIASNRSESPQDAANRRLA